MRCKILQFLLLCMVQLSLAPALSQAHDLDPMLTGVMPGDTAPPLIVSKWLRGESIDDFEPGRVYVVDMWATWCPGCLKTMPELNRLHAKYSEDLTLIAMNVWEFSPQRIPSILEAMGDSMIAIVALDSIPDGKDINEGLTAIAYIGTSGHISIPRTYLINRQGFIAWIGSPRDLAAPLTQVMNGTWNLEPFANEYVSHMEVELHYVRLVDKVASLIDAGNWEGAYQASEDIVRQEPKFTPRIAHSGFASIAMKILKLEKPGRAAALAKKSAERAVELKKKPDWTLLKLAAEASSAAGDDAAARKHLQLALQNAPDQQREKLAAALEALARHR